MVNKAVDDSIGELVILVYKQVIDLDSTTNVLKKLTGLMRSPETRSELSCDLWEPIIKLSKLCLQFLDKNDETENELELLKELLRFLRNCCSGSLSNQNFILSQDDLISFSKQILKHCLPRGCDKDVLILKICIQLFGNMLVGNENAKPFIWSLFFDEKIFGLLFQHKDLGIQECAMMVLFNCMSEETNSLILNTKEGREIFVSVTNTLLTNQIDWGMLFIESMLKQEIFFHSYHILPVTNRLLVLDIVTELLKSSQGDCNFCLPGCSLEAIKLLFLGQIAQLHNKVSEMEPAETVALLSILCAASISDEYISILQSSKKLVESSVECLKCIHLLGKEGCNIFSSLSETKHMSSQFGAEIAGHPLYGFKKNLIRLIGNLCYNCKDNQDLVRRLDGIPLVLDCCKFDAKNPYITQWCILAIRNIMDNNVENQAILAGTSLSGEIADIKYLQEMGFQVQNENGKFRITSKLIS